MVCQIAEIFNSNNFDDAKQKTKGLTARNNTQLII